MAQQVQYKPGDKVAVNMPGVGWSNEGDTEHVVYTVQQVNDVNLVLDDGYVVLTKNVRPAFTVAQAQSLVADYLLTSGLHTWPTSNDAYEQDELADEIADAFDLNEIERDTVFAAVQAGEPE